MTKKEDIYKLVKEMEPVCKEACQFIWNHPEVGGTEKAASDYYRTLLTQEGFHIVNHEKLPHAFYAEYGSGKPVIAILGEYDALPGLSQKVSAHKEAVEGQVPGHGCGHNLLGAAAVTGGIAVKHFLEKEEISGTVRVYGCPEEELLCGKVKMSYYHMFDGCDLAIAWHPMSTNVVFDQAYLASASVRFHFKGLSSHAAFAPEQGRSALDAVELMSVGCNYLREHVMDQTRIHYTTDSGGYAPNIVQPNASAWYYVRAPHMSDVKDTLERIKKIAQGAAMMTETEVTVAVDSGCYEMKRNTKFADLTYRNIIEANDTVYTEKEISFAEELQDTLNQSLCEKEKRFYNTQKAIYEGITEREQWKVTPMMGSSDSGDVSYIMPMNTFTTTCWPIGVAPHTWQSCAAAGSSIGEKGAILAAKVIAGIAYDLYNSQGTVKEIVDEFEAQQSAYSPMYEE